MLKTVFVLKKIFYIINLVSTKKGVQQLLNGYRASGETDELLSITDFIETTNALLQTSNEKKKNFTEDFESCSFHCLISPSGSRWS